MSVNGMQTLIYLVLARLLMPEDFGVVVLVGAFVAVSNVLANSGLGTALIQSKQVDETDYSTVLYFSLLVSCSLYLVIFLAAPKVAVFYDKPFVESILRIYAVSIIISAFNGIQKSILLRELRFKQIYLVSAISVLLSGAISITMAVFGFGVLALVFNSILFGLFTTVLFFVVTRWIPKLLFSVSRLKTLLAFSYKILLSNLLETGYLSIFPMLIGKSFSSDSLGYYNNGRQMPSLVANTINQSINSVTFTIYSRYQSDKAKLKSMVRKTITLSNFVILPAMAFLAVAAEPLVTVVLTEKWLPSVPFLQLFCVVYGLQHQNNITFQAISAIGRSDVFLRYQIIKKVIGVALLLATLNYEMIYLIMGQILTAFLSVIVTLRPNRIYLDYSVAEQLLDFIPYLFITILMYVGVYVVGVFVDGNFTKLFLQVVFGMSFYLLFAFLFKLKGIYEAQEIISSYFAKRISSDN